MKRDEAISKILEAGWKPCYPVENVPLINNYFWDGDDQTVGYAWLAAYQEIERRKQPQQLEMDLKDA
jgi:hypothetical protein